jgi:membrane associated rhomboid family serine protease
MACAQRLPLALLRPSRRPVSANPFESVYGGPILAAMFIRITPVNRALILVNVGVFVLQWLLGPAMEIGFALWPPGAPALGGPPFRIWQLLTYGFLHGRVLHIFFNMFALFMFGTAVEQALGSRRYLIYFLVSVVGAGLMHVIITVAAGLQAVPIIGASGGVMAVLVAFGMFFPHQRLIIFPIPVPIKAWIAVILYGLFDLVMGVSQNN